MKTRITIRDIAAQAGVHFSTVARALRNDSRLTAETRQRIQGLAETLGYSPDPAVTALAAYRSDRIRDSYSGTVIWLTTHQTRDNWRRVPDFVSLHRAAEARANALGYTLEVVCLPDLGSSAERATRTLTARGIAGILVPPSHANRIRIRLDWSRFCAISLSYTISYPKLHLATNHQYRSMSILMRRLRRLGYRRMALVLVSDERVDHNWLAGFLVEQRRLRPADRIPDFNSARCSEEEIGQWLAVHRPDVVISQDRRVRKVMEDLGWKIPGDIGLAYPDCQPGSDVSGITQNFQKVGEVAFDHLVGMLHRGERGIPAIPIRLLVEGTWVEGSTVRRVNSGAR
jgi:DNA-binding LacI/PurR family transcriptional regulator